MPRLDQLDNQIEENSIPGHGTYKFSAKKPKFLGASEYTLVTICIDISGSVEDFADLLNECLIKILKACEKSERSENLMVRLLTFNHNVTEVHGFIELHSIDISIYKPFNTGGTTALFDCVYNGIGASVTYAETLIAQGFNVNGAVYIITDGDDNASLMKPNNIKESMNESLRTEKIESLNVVLVGVKYPNVTGAVWFDHISVKLETFKIEANLTQYVDVGDATPQKLAKLADFVSRSISSQSNAINTGAPSQPVNINF